MMDMMYKRKKMNSKKPSLFGQTFKYYQGEITQSCYTCSSITCTCMCTYSVHTHVHACTCTCYMYILYTHLEKDSVGNSPDKHEEELFYEPASP